MTKCIQIISADYSEH